MRPGAASRFPSVSLAGFGSYCTILRLLRPEIHVEKGSASPVTDAHFWVPALVLGLGILLLYAR